MFKSLCVILLAVFSSAWGDDSTLPKEINPIDYLTYFNIRRAFVEHRHVLEANVSSAAAEKVRTHDDYQRHVKLYEKGAVTEESLNEARMTYDIAVADYEQSLHRLDFNRAESDILEVRIAFATGEPEDVRRIYPHYKHQWEADCRVKETELAAAKAHAKFEQSRLTMYRKLLPTQAVTQSQYEVAEVRATQATNLQKARQIIVEDCDKGLPTLEQLVKLQEAEPNRPPPRLRLPDLLPKPTR